MLKLILRLFGLFSPLLLLDHSKCILWLFLYVLTQALCPFIFDLVLYRLLIIHCIYSLRPSISNSFFDAPYAKRLLICTIIQCFLVVIIDNMH